MCSSRGPHVGTQWPQKPAELVSPGGPDKNPRWNLKGCSALGQHRVKRRDRPGGEVKRESRSEKERDWALVLSWPSRTAR